MRHAHQNTPDYNQLTRLVEEMFLIWPPKEVAAILQRQFMLASTTEGFRALDQKDAENARDVVLNLTTLLTETAV